MTAPIFLILICVNFAANLFAIDSKYICYKQIEMLETNFSKALNTKKYPRRHRKLVKKAMLEIGINEQSLKISLEKIKNEIDSYELLGTPKYLVCQIRTSGILSKLEAIAQKGGRKLNYFGDTLEFHLPRQAFTARPGG